MTMAILQRELRYVLGMPDHHILANYSETYLYLYCISARGVGKYFILRRLIFKIKHFQQKLATGGGGGTAVGLLNFLGEWHLRAPYPVPPPADFGKYMLLFISVFSGVHGEC